MTGPVEELYRSERARVARLAFLLTGDRAVAEDVAQEAFARLLPRYDALRQPEAFLTTVVVNLCRDRGRRQATAARHRWEEPAAAPPPPLPHDVSALWQLVQALPQNQREVVVLRYWADLAPKEIARLTGAPSGTVRSLLHRALASLEKELDDVER